MYENKHIVKIIGGLGNQLFQYAFYRSIKEDNPNTKLDITAFDSYKLHHGFELEMIFPNAAYSYAQKDEIAKLADNKNDFLSRNRRKIFGNRKQSHVIEKGLIYNDNYLRTTGDTYYDGYWQSYKYFDKIKDIIREELRFNNLSNSNDLRIAEIARSRNSVSIHVRRGDYVNHPLYSNISTLNYYNKSIEHMNKLISSPIYIVFSDDIDWCRSNLNLSVETEYVDWNNNENYYRDMQLMSLCKNNIIANSSFSWWGAWLNGNIEKIVCAPSRWLNSNDYNIEDIIPKDWTKIDV